MYQERTITPRAGTFWLDRSQKQLGFQSLPTQTKLFGYFSTAQARGNTERGTVQPAGNPAVCL